MPGHLSLSALSAANIIIISIQTTKRIIFFYISSKKACRHGDRQTFS
uniref:Uncharacterized protein n=1 Tax=Myoviridae sp. ctLEM34 TaxID=2825082 RepID=A0A8S5TR48_9CAUD|nr:MAG TPA: hypothetical protein [Myoviridae sp. ctLEM34]